MPRSRASGCASWRVRAASARTQAAQRPGVGRALRDGRAAPRRRASPPLSRRAPDRPARAPEMASSWHQPSRLAAVAPSPDDLRTALAEFVSIPSVSADTAHAADVEAAASWVASRIDDGGGKAELVPWGTRPLVIGEFAASRARETRARSSATRTSTSSRRIRSSSGPRPRSSSRNATAACTRGASRTTRGTCSSSSRRSASSPRRASCP